MRGEAYDLQVSYKAAEIWRRFMDHLKQFLMRCDLNSLTFTCRRRRFLDQYGLAGWQYNWNNVRADTARIARSSMSCRGYCGCSCCSSSTLQPATIAARHRPARRDGISKTDGDTKRMNKKQQNRIITVIVGPTLYAVWVLTSNFWISLFAARIQQFDVIIVIKFEIITAS